MSSKSLPIVLRLRSNGDFDHSFGKRGVSMLKLKGYGSFNDVAVTKKGTIYLAGSYRGTQAGTGKIGVYSFTGSGGINRSFSKDGRTTVLRGSDSQAEALLIQRNGRIVVGGRSDQPGVDWLLVRLKTTGKLDKSFSGDGTTTTDFSNSGDVVEGLVEQGNGKLVGAGYGFGVTALARYLRDGSLDG